MGIGLDIEHHTPFLEMLDDERIRILHEHASPGSHLANKPALLIHSL